MSAPRTPEQALAEDMTYLREVVESQSRLGHPMTLVPNDVLVRILAARLVPVAELERLKAIEAAARDAARIDATGGRMAIARAVRLLRSLLAEQGAAGTDLPSEYGRLLAERDRLIADGVDPATLDVPLPPEQGDAKVSDAATFDEEPLTPERAAYLRGYAEGAHANLTCDCVSMDEHEDRYLAAPPETAQPDSLRAALRARLLQMANVAAEKRPMTDVARGYERACDELLEWLAALSDYRLVPVAELERLRALSEAATPGRWFVDDSEEVSSEHGDALRENPWRVIDDHEGLLPAVELNDAAYIVALVNWHRAILTEQGDS